MAKVHITKEFCNELLRQERDTLERYTDEKLAGFQLRIGPSNHIAFYACSRLSGGSRRLDRKIGVLGKMTLAEARKKARKYLCLLYTSPSPRDRTRSRMPSSA